LHEVCQNPAACGAGGILAERFPVEALSLDAARATLHVTGTVRRWT